MLVDFILVQNKISLKGFDNLNVYFDFKSGLFNDYFI